MTDSAIRLLALIALGLGALAPRSVVAADAAATCQAQKLKAAAKLEAGALRCHADAATRGSGVDAGCVSAESGRLVRLFAALDSRGTCLTNGDGPAVAGVITGRAADVAAWLRPTTSASGCAATKLFGVRRGGQVVLNALAKQRKRVNDRWLVGLWSDFRSLVASDFGLAEADGGCLTTRDALPAAKRMAAAAGDVVEMLWPASVVGLTFAHPADWNLNPVLLALSGGPTIELNNYDVLGGNSGPFPKDGAEIGISRGPLPAEPLQQLVARRLSGMGNTKVETAVVGGAAGTRARFTTDFDPNITLATIDVYVPRGPYLYQFSLSYYPDDAVAASVVTAFDGVLASVAFTTP